MKVVCAWCGKDMGGKPPIVEDKDITHGMCLDCYRKELEKIKEWEGQVNVRIHL